MESRLEYFMWGYQPHFVIGAKVRAESLCGMLDIRLDPQVGLVGFLAEERDDRHTICIEPQDWVFQPEAFEAAHARAKELIGEDPDRKMLHSHPIAEEDHRKRSRRKAYRNAIVESIEKTGLAPERTFFCAGPTRVESFDIYVVLGLKTEAIRAHPSLRTEVRDRMSVPVSLIRSAVSRFLEECCRELAQPDPGSGFGFGSSADEILRAAGVELMYAPSSATRELDGLHGLFDSCTRIAAIPYEGAPPKGTIIISPRIHPALQANLVLAEPVPLRQSRAVRKLLCLTECEQGEALLSDASVVYGVGAVAGAYDPSSEEVHEIRFHGLAEWELRHAGESQMTVKFGEPRLPAEKVEEGKLRADVKRVLSQIQDDALDRLWSLVSSAAAGGHGTIIVVAQDAQGEAKRLKGECTSVTPFEMTLELLGMTTRIDGAVILDTKCICWAIGAVLDGMAVGSGDPGRGSRYNSALRYAHSAPCRTYLIVISDDGSVDLVPNLKPQIQRSWIGQNLDALFGMAKREEVSARAFNNAMGNLSSLRFYVGEEDCERINKARDVISAKLLESHKMVVKYSDFAPDPGMDDSYFLDE
jgi:Probable sensor domain DACNG/Probable sensor domain DACNH